MRSKPALTFVSLAVSVLAIGLVIVSICSASVVADTSGDRQHPDHSSIYRVSSFTPELLKPVVLEVVESPLLPQEFARVLETSSSAVSDVLRIAPAKSSVAPRVPTTSAGRDIRLTTIAVDPSFPRFFPVKSRGQDLSTMDNRSGVWLTQKGLERIREAGGDEAFVAFGEAAMPILGVIDDPHPTSHLQYEAVVGFDQATRYENTILGTRFHYPAYTYIKAKAPVEEVAPDVRKAFVAALGLEAEIGLTPIIHIRNGSAKQLPYEADFVSSGRALEVLAASASGGLGLIAVLVAVGLLGQALYASQRHALGVQLCLGQRSSVAFWKASGSMFVVLLSAGALAVVTIVMIGPAVFRSLGKPNGLEGLEVTIGLTLIISILTLQVAASLALIPLRVAKPMSLVGSNPGSKQQTFRFTVSGLGLLCAGAASVLFISAMFYAEVATGSKLDNMTGRGWIVPVSSAGGSNPLGLARGAASQLRADPQVAAAGVLNWQPFGGTSLNMSVKRIGADKARYVQATILTGDAFYPAMVGAELMAGRFDPVVDETVCLALIDSQALDIFGFPTPANAIGQRIQAGTSQRDCQIVGVVGKQRIGKMSAPSDPTVHLVGSDFATSTDGADVPIANLLVIFRPGVSESDQLARLRAVGPRLPAPLNVADLGSRAYTRETRIAQLLGGCAIALATALLCVCIALAMNAVERQRHSVAVRQALGSRVWPLTLMFAWPVIMGSLTGAFLAGLAVMLLGPLWQEWGGLASPLGLTPYLAMMVGLTVPVAVTILAGQLLLRSVRPGESLKSAAT